MPSRWRHRLAIAAVVLVVLTAALAAGTWLAARRYGPTLARERVEAGLTAVLGRTVTVERVDIEPWLGRVVIAGIRAAADPGSGDPHLASIGRVEAHVGIASLWQARLVLRRLLAQDVDLLIVAAGGPALHEIPLLPEIVRLGPAEVRLTAVELVRARLVFRDTSAGRRVEVSGLAATGRPGPEATDVSLTADTIRVAAPSIDERVEAVRLEARIRPDRIDLGRGEFRLDGRPVSASGRIDQPLGETALALDVRGEVDLARIRTRAALTVPMTGIAAVTGRLAGSPATPTAHLAVSAAECHVGPVTARQVGARLAWDGRVLQLSEVSARAFDGMVTGALELDVRRPEGTRLDADMKDVSLAALEALGGAATGIAARLDATVHAIGDLSAPARARGTGRVDARQVRLPGAGAGLGPGAVTIEGRFADGAVDLAQATGTWPGFAAEASGRLTVDGPAPISLRATGELARAGELLGRRDARGAATLEARLHGRWSALAIVGRLDAAKPAVAGWRADDVTIPFEWSGRSLRLAAATARLGQSRLEVSGTAALADRAPLTAMPRPEDVRLALAVRTAPASLDDVAPWLPAGWRGAGLVTIRAQVEGPLDRLRVEGHAESARLTVGPVPPIEQLTARFTATSDHVDVTAATARVLGVPVSARGRATWAGAVDAEGSAGPVELAGLAGVPPAALLTGRARAHVTAAMRGGAVDATARVEAERVGAVGFALGPGTADVRLRGGALTAEAVFPDVRGRLQANGRLDAAAPIAVRAQVADVALAPLVARFLPEARGRIDGVLSASAELTVPWNDPSASKGTVRLEPVRLDVWGERWASRGPVIVRREPGRTVVEPFAMTGRTGEVTGQARLDDTGPIDATLRGRIPLALLTTVSPEVTDAAGELDVELRAGGTRAAPTLLGHGRVAGGLVAVRDVPQVVRGLTGRFSVRPDRLHVEELRGSFGSGTFQASGGVAIEGLAPGAYQLRVAARNISGATVPGLDAFWDADLELSGRAARAVVTGEVRLVRGLYTRELALLPMLLEPAARPAEPGFGSTIGLRVTIKLDDNLVIRTRQAQLRGGGTLSLQGTAAAPVVFGSLETRDGSVRFQRHRFAIERAVVRFDDPRGVNPAIDLRATTRIRTWDVTMELTGRAADLQVRLTSSPPMSQEDLLALVALGATREELGHSPGPVFAAAAGRALAEQFIGLAADRPLFDGDAKDGDGPLAALGQHVTERTLVTYSGGFAEGGRQKVRMEYQVVGPVLLSGEQDFRGGFGGDVIVRLRFR